jgi:hypothetical protein
MNASPLLATLLAAMRDEKLEAVLIGNAAAAMQGAPVTTLDFDFMFRDTPANMQKLKRISRRLEGVILRPFYPVSKFYRLTADATGLQADFMPVIDGIRSFDGLRSRAILQEVAGIPLRIACLDDIIASKRAASRDRDLAVLPVLERPAGNSATPSALLGRRKPNDPAPGDPMPAKKRSRPRAKPASRKARLAALRKESDRQLEELIRRRLAMPLEQRMNFLRIRLPGGGSCL